MTEGRRPIDERKLKRLRSIAQVLAVVSLAVFGALIAFSAYRLHGIQEALRRSSDELTKQNTQLAETMARRADLEGDVAELEERIVTLRSTLQDFVSSVEANSSRLAIDATSEAIEANPEAAALVPRIYLHIGDEKQRPAAKEIGELLQAAGFLVPGIENVGSERSPKRTTLKRFRHGDQDDEDVQAAVTTLGAARDPGRGRLREGFRGLHPDPAAPLRAVVRVRLPVADADGGQVA